MHTNNFFLLLFGLDIQEKLIIENICKISKAREVITYIKKDDMEEMLLNEQEMRTTYNIAIVDYSNSKAMKAL